VELKLPGVRIEENVRQFLPVAEVIKEDSAGPYISGPVEFKPPWEIIGTE
jgi:hypothetical protein